MKRSIEIEDMGMTLYAGQTRYRLLVDGGQAGLYTTQIGAKQGARRFVKSWEAIRWHKTGVGEFGLKAEIVNRPQSRKV